MLDPTALTLRSLEMADLPAALALQSQCYPAFLLEDETAFASRIRMAASYCLAAKRDEVLVGYLLAHGWATEAPPPVGTILPKDAASEVLYVHDLAVSFEARGLQVGRRLIAEALSRAATDGLHRAELIAVEGAHPYWRALGFEEAATQPALAEKVSGYGAAAVWMARSIG